MDTEWKKLSKSDLLLAGWHEVPDNEVKQTWWHHPNVLGGHSLNGAKHIQHKNSERLSNQ